MNLLRHCGYWMVVGWTFSLAAGLLLWPLLGWYSAAGATVGYMIGCVISGPLTYGIKALFERDR